MQAEEKPVIYSPYAPFPPGVATTVESTQFTSGDFSWQGSGQRKIKSSLVGTEVAVTTTSWLEEAYGKNSQI